jgi:hypothetical protein
VKISSKSTGVSGAGGIDDTQQQDSINQSIQQLEQMMQTVLQQQQTGVQTADPTQLAQGITNNLKALQGPQEQGQLSPEQDSRIQSVLQQLTNVMQGNGAQNQNQQTGFPTDDKYEANKVGTHHHGGHAHAPKTPPVDGTDPDSNTVGVDPNANTV